MTKRIVICDDEIHILRAAEIKFNRAGYQVFIAADGEEGWRLIREHKPDAVVTDYQMPVLDGLSLAARIRDSEFSGLPVVMLTARGFELSSEQVKREYGLAHLASKPFSPRELLERIERLIDERTVQRELAAQPV